MNPGDSVKFDRETNTLHIEQTDGVRFFIAGKVVSGDIKLTKNTTVRAFPRGRLFDEGVETEWSFKVSEDAAPAETPSEESSEVNEVEDTPPAPAAGTTPESPEQQVAQAESGLRFGRP